MVTCQNHQPANLEAAANNHWLSRSKLAKLEFESFSGWSLSLKRKWVTWGVRTVKMLALRFRICRLCRLTHCRPDAAWEASASGWRRLYLHAGPGIARAGLVGRWGTIWICIHALWVSILRPASKTFAAPPAVLRVVRHTVGGYDHLQGLHTAWPLDRANDGLP